jgi:putative inorganic carbon (HCO3(-)) transporter
VRLVVAGLVSTALSGNSALVGLPISPDRVLLLAGVGLFFLSGSHRAAERLRWRPIYLVMLAMTAWTAWSGLTHGTLATSYGFYALLDRIVVPFGLFALAPLLFAREEDRQLLLKAFVALGLYLGVTAVFEMLGPTSLVFPRYIMDPDVGILFGRARGPFVAAEADGMILALCMGIALLAIGRLQRAWRVAAVIAVPLTAVGVVLSLTRSVWLGLGLAVVVLMVLVPASRRLLIGLVTVGAAAFVAILTSFPVVRELLVERLTTERSVFDRQNTNAAALRIVHDRPIDGIGWVRFQDQAVEWVRQADTYPVTNVTIEVHNVVLSRAAELGLVGAALWVACVVAGPVLAVWRAPRDPALSAWRPVYVSYACVWSICIMLSPVPYVMVNYMLWLLAGMMLREHLVEPRLLPATGNAAPAGDRVG